MTVATVLVDSLVLVVVKSDGVISLRIRNVETDICTVMTYDEHCATRVLIETFTCETL